MSDVGLRLILETDDKGGSRKIQRMEDKFSRLRRTVEGGSARIHAGFQRIGRGIRSAAAHMKRFVNIGRLALAGLATAAIITGAKFEAAMANVAAISGATGDQLRLLTLTARGLGEVTAFSASQAADAMTALAQAGQSVGQIVESVGSVLLFAGAAGTTMGEAAEALVQTLATFGIAAANSDRVINVFAASLTTSLLNAERLREGLSQIGATANALGLSLEKTTANLALLNNSGQLGAVAGTRLKNVLTRLASPNAVLRKLMGGLAFTGKNLGKVMDRLAASGATTGEIFQSFGRIAGPAVLVLMREGSKGADKMTKAITGTNKAQDMFDTQMKATTKVFAIFKSALQENMIATFTVMGPLIQNTLRGMTRGLKILKPVILGVALTVKQWIDKNQENIRIMAKVVGAVGLVLVAIVTFKALVVGAVLAVIFVFIKFRAKIAEAFGAIKEFFQKIFERIRGFFQKIVGFLNKLIPQFGDMFVAMGEFAVDTAKDMPIAMGQSFNDIAEGAKQMGANVVGVVDRIKAKFREMTEEGRKAGATLQPKGTTKTFQAKALDEKSQFLLAFGFDPAVMEKALIAFGLKTIGRRRASLVEAIGNSQTHTEAWLDTRLALLEANYEDEKDKRASSLEGLASLELEHAQATADIRMEFEDAVLEHFLEANELRAQSIFALGDAYSDITNLFIRKEESFDRIRHALLANFRKTFIKSAFDMAKNAVVASVRAILVSDALKRKSAASERFREAKLGGIKAFKSFADIPIVGPVLGAAAAAAAFAFLMAFEKGGMVGVSRAGAAASSGAAAVPILAHRGEFVVRKSAVQSAGAENLEFINRTGQLPAGSGLGASFNFEIHGGDGRSTDDIVTVVEDVVIPILEDAIGGRNFSLGTSS